MPRPESPNEEGYIGRAVYACGFPGASPALRIYWIVDPELGQIRVLTLNNQTYVVHGEFKRGDQAASKLLPGFAVDVTSALDPKR
jgi:Uma2 family endonuclease